MEYFNIRLLTPDFHIYLDRQLSENRLKGKWFERWRGAYKWSKYIPQLWTSKSTVSFGNKAWGKELKIFYSYMSLTHAIEAYLLTLLSFSSLMATFEIFHKQKFGMEKYAHIQFWSWKWHWATLLDTDLVSLLSTWNLIRLVSE